MRHSFKLEEESFAQFRQVERSIQYWSVEMGKLQLQLDAAKSHLLGMYEARDGLLKKAVEDAGFNASKIDDVQVGQGGQILVVMSDPEPDGPAEDAKAAPVPPVGPPAS